MRTGFRPLSLAALLLLAAFPARPSVWSDEHTPFPGPALSIGKPVAGCLSGGESLPFDGPGYQVIRISRDRYYGNPATVSFIKDLGRKAKAAGLEDFYVGDMSLPRGGPMPNGHASHETGLDVDIWDNLDPKPVLPPRDREEVPLPSVLSANGKSLDPARFSSRIVTLLRLAATDPRVDRIFVNPVIKRALCKGAFSSAVGDRSWLHRLRPWYGHDEHFHVRLACPEGSPDCEPQAPVPPGDGCDSTLAAWFKPRQPQPQAAPPPRRPILPAACQRLIQR
jgi:penicillin-insensitive murein DD-endopeptidase